MEAGLDILPVSKVLPKSVDDVVLILWDNIVVFCTFLSVFVLI